MPIAYPTENTDKLPTIETSDRPQVAIRNGIVQTNDVVITAMDTARLCAFCLSIATGAPVEILQSLYNDCVKRHQEATANQTENRKLKREGQPFTDYSEPIFALQNAMQALRDAASAQGASISNCSRRRRHWCREQDLVLLRDAERLLSERSDDEAEQWRKRLAGYIEWRTKRDAELDTIRANSTAKLKAVAEVIAAANAITAAKSSATKSAPKASTQKKGKGNK